MKDIDYTDKPRYLPCWFLEKDNYVMSALIADGFEYLGMLEDITPPDYLQVVMGNWSLGSICPTNELIALCDGAIFGINCVGEADYELRWSSTKKLLMSKLRTYQASPANYTQLSLFVA
ncbi:hypothetical protein [Richelia sinica]|uniref:hypothetical protein n=1 Tax=Richelia sinica TaxID=1357545 RepID=UPI001686B2B2|nr:hypothetical protein [Richelia sinica]MBD2667269.1 hypothetical protein [Richelia sinica FACHB-800]